MTENEIKKIEIIKADVMKQVSEALDMIYSCEQNCDYEITINKDAYCAPRVRWSAEYTYRPLINNY